MKKLSILLGILLLSVCAMAHAQSLLTIAPQQCVWHEGDDMHWAAPELEDSGWSSYADRTPNSPAARLWIRCHADLSSLQATAHPALQVSMLAAYQLFVNGRPAGAFGDMKTGDFTADDIRTFPLATPLPRQARSIIVLRLLRRVVANRAFSDVLKTDSPELFAGDQGSLEDRRNSLAFIDGSRQLPTTVAFGIVGIAGFMLLGLYLSDRSRLAYLYFAINCWALASLRMLQQLEASYCPISTIQYRLIEGFLVAAIPFIVFMVYALARKPVPLFYLVVSGLSLGWPLLEFITALAPAAQSLRIDASLHKFAVVSTLLFDGLMFLSPFTAFRPWRRVSGSARYVAVNLMLWAIANEVFVFFRLGLNLSLSLFTPFVHAWMPLVQPVRAAFILSAIVVLLILLFREQRKTAEERALLAGEMHAAQQIQRILVPESLPTAPGLNIDAVFRPAREVGGDFYRCRVLPNGTQRILIGDVSGKGAAAAMTGAMLLGASEGHEAGSPADLLSHLNRTLCMSGLEGFATCLCLDVAADGQAAFSNAGHISPYRAGQECSAEAGLPLGIAPDVEYAEAKLQMAPGDTLTLLSDGVPEARNASGELFGFERTAAISMQTAGQIASSAEHFGQDDDITVLTLTRHAALP